MKMAIIGIIAVVVLASVLLFAWYGWWYGDGRGAGSLPSTLPPSLTDREACALARHLLQYPDLGDIQALSLVLTMERRKGTIWFRAVMEAKEFEGWPVAFHGIDPNARRSFAFPSPPDVVSVPWWRSISTPRPTDEVHSSPVVGGGLTLFLRRRDASVGECFGMVGYDLDTIDPMLRALLLRSAEVGPRKFPSSSHVQELTFP